MMWPQPHPSNTQRAEEFNEASRAPAAEQTAIVTMAIADRLAGIEEALTIIALSQGRVLEGADDAIAQGRVLGAADDALGQLARRVEAEAHSPAPRR